MRPSIKALIFVITLVATLLAPAGVLAEPSGTAVVDGGGLTMAVVASPSFPPITLDGSDQTTTGTITIDVNDARGSGAGWSLQMTSTVFANEQGQTLPADSLTITGVDVRCDQGSCVNPANDVAYPLPVPSGAVAPAAATIYRAAPGTGMGDFTVTPVLQLSIPASAYAGTYQSTFVISIASAP